MNPVLLPGAGGFIGCHVSALLHTQGFEVNAVPSRQVEETESGIRGYPANVLDSPETSRFMEEIRPTYLLHLFKVIQVVAAE